LVQCVRSIEDAKVWKGCNQSSKSPKREIPERESFLHPNMELLLRGVGEKLMGIF
jgi:hypothetical protein